jgi:hypothetical protein
MVHAAPHSLTKRKGGAEVANTTKAEAAAALAVAGIPRRSFSIPQFCARNDLSEGFYRKLRKLKLGPRETRVLDRVVITLEAETQWLGEGESA